MYLIVQIKNYLNQGNERTILAKKNIIGSFFNKGFAILISLLLIPITIDYLNPEQYGIWLTISSIVSWITYFDIGLVHGFKNRFTEAKANGNILLQRQYVSTAYAAIAIIFSFIIIVLECINPFIHWSKILKVNNSYDTVLTLVSATLILFIGIQLMLGVISALLTADQRSAFAAAIGTLGQGLALLCIYILTQLPYKSMIYICIALSGMPCLVLIIATLWLFGGKYRKLSPSISCVKFQLVGNIIGLGSKFFVIQLSMLLIFQITNIILSRVLGPEAVTLYNVTYKYFSVIQMILTIILSPFWAAYTDAFVKKDFEWMNKTYHKLTSIFTKIVILSVIMLIVSPFIFRLWLPDSIKISWTLSITMWLYIIVLTYSNLFMIIINGTGKVFVQMIIYLIFASISIPSSYFFCQQFGISGILVIFTLSYAIQAYFARIQLAKLLNNKANGIWNK